MFKFSKASEARLAHVDERLISIARRALEISKVDFGIPEFGGLRTAEQQYELFRDGKSQLDGTNKKSYHQSGKALDVYAYVGGRASWNEYHLSMIACAMLQAAAEFGVKLEWGGLWAHFIDYPHFEIKD